MRISCGNKLIPIVYELCVSTRNNISFRCRPIGHRTVVAIMPNQVHQSADRPSFSNMVVNLAFSIFIPVWILRSYSAPEQLGPMWALVVALSFPLALGLFEFIQKRNIGLIPAIGFISILLTGGIGLLQLPKEYIAIKEALVPLGFGLAVLASAFTKKPLIKTFIYNEVFLHTDQIDQRIDELEKRAEFDSIMLTATWILAASFLVSSVLNYLCLLYTSPSPRDA